MKLTDLNPKFYGAGGPGVTRADGSPAPHREGVALVFDCPCGGECLPVAVEFANPLDGGPPLRSDGHTWQRTGDTFETLTLQPSILRRDFCKWHGWIRAGEVISC